MPSPLIAVLDDDESVRRALTRLLRSAGLNASAYGSAAEFLDRGIASGPACLILDIHLGGMSGLELLSRLRESGHHMPIVVITAHDDIQVRESVEQAGCSAYLRKPIEGRALLEEVAAAMKRAA